jgi:hypothetical protein
MEIREKKSYLEKIKQRCSIGNCTHRHQDTDTTSRRKKARGVYYGQRKSLPHYVGYLRSFGREETWPNTLTCARNAEGAKALGVREKNCVENVTAR